MPSENSEDERAEKKIEVANKLGLAFFIVLLLSTTVGVWVVQAILGQKLARELGDDLLEANVAVVEEWLASFIRRGLACVAVYETAFRKGFVQVPYEGMPFEEANAIVDYAVSTIANAFPEYTGFGVISASGHAVTLDVAPLPGPSAGLALRDLPNEDIHSLEGHPDDPARLVMNREASFNNTNPWSDYLFEQEGHVFTHYYNRPDDSIYMLILTYLRSETGTIMGKMLAARNLESLSVFLQHRVSSSSARRLFVIDDDGFILASSHGVHKASPYTEGKEMRMHVYDSDDAVVSQVSSIVTEMETTGIHHRFDIDTSEGTFYGKVASHEGFSIVLLLPHAELYGKLDYARKIGIVALSVALAVSLLLILALYVYARKTQRAVSAIERNRELSKINAILSMEVEERKKATHEAELARDAAEAANRAKGQFLANMSHELRTPLSGIILSNRAIIEMGLTHAQEQLASTNERSAKFLVDMVNDILSVCRLDEKKEHVTLTEVDVMLVVEDSVKIFHHDALLKRMGLYCDVGPPSRILADVGKLRQLIINFANNAIKFTREGHVRVSCRTAPLASASPRVGSDEGPAYTHELSVEVSDTGIGIAEEDIGKIFSRFSQVDSTDTRNFGGSGLGLAISQQLIHLMGGEIGVRSEFGKGSTFWFRIPVTAVNIGEEERVFSEQTHVLYSVLPAAELWAIASAYAASLGVSCEGQILDGAKFLEQGLPGGSTESPSKAKSLRAATEYAAVLVDEMMSERDPGRTLCTVIMLPDSLAYDGLASSPTPWCAPMFHSTGLIVVTNDAAACAPQDPLGRPIEVVVLPLRRSDLRAAVERLYTCLANRAGHASPPVHVHAPPSDVRSFSLEEAEATEEYSASFVEEYLATSSSMGEPIEDNAFFVANDANAVKLMLGNLSTTSSADDNIILLGGRSTSPTKTSIMDSSVLSDGPSIRILYAEDNPVNQLVTTQLLELSGHVCDVVEDGQKCVETLMLENHGYDVLLLDCQMPRRDGWSTAQYLREHGIDVPIIAVTAGAGEGVRQRCMDSGMDDFLNKPFEPVKLRTLVKKWSAKRRSEREKDAREPC